MLGRMLVLSCAHTWSEGHSTALQSIESTLLLEIKVLIYIMVANLYVRQNTEDNKSFLWHKQLNYDITAILQIWANTYVNPAEQETNQGRLPCLSCCWKELVFLHVLRRKAPTSFLYSARHIVGIFSWMLEQQRLIDRSYFWL